MLNAPLITIDHEIVSRRMNELACEDFEFYFERIACMHVTIKNRLTRVMPSRTAGIGLRVSQNGVIKRYFRNDLDLEQLLASLGAAPDPNLILKEPKAPSWPHFDKVQRLAKAAEEREIRYEDRNCLYSFFSSDGRQGGGQEEFAAIKWDGQKCVSSSIERLWKEILPLQKEWTKPSTNIVRWPIPAGEIAILWTPQALAQLILPFLRHFESDRLLRDESILSTLSFPQPFKFTLVDYGSSHCDHEGISSTEIPLFVDGRPRSLALSVNTALEMGVPPTGNARRQSYTHPPTVGFWNIRLAGHIEVDDPLRSLGNGLIVNSARFDAGENLIHIEKARLVHDTEIGEVVEETHVILSLVEFLKSLDRFSKLHETVGIEINKAGQRFITDCEIPFAISPAIRISGNPEAAYW